MKHFVSSISPAHSFGALPAQPWWVRRRWQLVGLLLSMLLMMGVRAQANVIITVGAGGNYTTIGAALVAVPSPLTQPYELRLLDAAYSEDVLLTKTGSAENPLVIGPAAGVSTVLTGTLTFGAGSAFASLNGNNGTISRALTVRQPSLTAPAVVFGNDASNNEVREAIVLGSNTLLTSGVVVIGGGLTSGNDNNTIIQSFVGNADPALLPANLLYAANAGGGTNDNFSLLNSQLFNFSRAGVFVGAGNGDQWTISGNSFYYNATAVPTTAQTAIDFRPGSGANGALVSSNFIGGRTAGATGGIWENAGTQNFKGIVMSCGNSTTLTNQVTGNTVRQVSLTGVSSASLTAMGVAAGRAELTGNTVTNVTNTGTSGVNSLVSQATTILNSFSVSNGQLMVVESGLTVVLGDLTNAGVLNHTGGDILINGNFTNTSTGTFAQTLGDLEVKGNMLNTGQFTCSTGKVKLTGAGNQTVSGGFYFNLEVNGGGVKTFTDDAEVYNGVQMLSGILATGPYRLKIDPLANLSETDASYVLGRVEVRRTPTEGDLEDFGGVGLTMLPAVGSTLPGATQVTRITGTAPVGVAGHQGILRYFDISAPTITGLNLGLTMSYFAHELNGIAPANLRFYKSVDNGVTWQNKGLTSAGSGFATLSGVSGFSRWTLGDLTAPLPVGLTAFRAERQGANAVLTWATATEQNNHGFGLEVSLDGHAFKQIGFVAAEGSNSSAPRAYRFVDAAEGKAGPRYYRLRQDDRDGTVHYYDPQLLRFDAAPATLAAYPTQFGPELTVALNHPTATTATLRLLDAMGREVWQQEQALTPGAAPVRVQPTCAAGPYILTATVGGQVLRQRVVKD
ncbi:autotransporter outer membrane beta-barrel domain-containing protein [Hymenobacter ruber]